MSAPLNLSDYEALARERMEAGAFDYYFGGAGDEVTLRANRAAFERVFLRPRALVDVSGVDPATDVLGLPLSMPVLLAPTAFHRLAHPEGELATARAAARAGTVMVASTIATWRLEEIAAAAPEAPRWFQLYVYKDRGLTEELVDRAAAAGYRAIVLTVDTPVLGRRERDVRNGFRLPEGVRIANFDHLEGKVAGIGGWREGSNFWAYVHDLFDASLDWSTVDWLRSRTALPVVVKGILHPDDARRAVEAGVDGIVVSNHGGRQLDGAIATIDALPDVVRAVDGRLEVLIDGGVRRGVDVVRALARGARAVLIGRPYLWALAAAGEEGVFEALSLLRREVTLAMALAGCPRVAAIGAELLVPGWGLA